MLRKTLITSAFVLAASAAGAQDGLIAAIGSDRGAPEGGTVIDASVRSIEQGDLIDAETAPMMVDSGLWLSPQLLVYRAFPPDLGAVRLEQQRMVAAGRDTMFPLAREYGNKTVFGTDVVVNPGTCVAQNKEFASLLGWFTPAGILAQATANTGEVLHLSGDRSPYPGVVGQIFEGEHADLLLIDGNPLEDITILEDHDAARALIIEGCIIYNNGL
ncbi:hypothetical protein [Roseobacter ponti]|uniref:Amidohydrolase-related domain-containing protein n=1 Tax=Roseobacter ponti TaxID=1891787 RepID=A0A858SW65_9RHOB|nr:hypothetical protein [Roseobacter ponti]QJF51106.1 hypothetical protein G3256_08000 [Roseobacter ponti]